MEYDYITGRDRWVMRYFGRLQRDVYDMRAAIDQLSHNVCRR